MAIHLIKARRIMVTIIFVGIIDFYNNLLYNIIIRKEVIKYGII